MADPYRQQYGPPPAWPPQAAPPPPPKRRGRGLTIALSIFAGLAILVGVVTIIGLTVGGDDTPTDSSTPQPASTPASTPASPAPNPSEARPGVDVGAGTPGAGCATSRLGWFFVKDGVTYVCQGPAPNRWLPKG